MVLSTQFVVDEGLVDGSGASGEAPFYLGGLMSRLKPRHTKTQAGNEVVQKGVD